MFSYLKCFKLFIQQQLLIDETHLRDREVLNNFTL